MNYKQLITKFFQSHNLAYSIDYELDIHRPCNIDPSICENDYCRCSVINSVDIKPDLDSLSYLSINLTQYVNKRTKLTIPKEIITYCILKNLQYNGGLCPDNYTYTTCSGYYGEELETIKYTGPTESYPFYFEKPAIDSIKEILALEYGNSLFVVSKATKVSIERVNLKDIYPGNITYLKEVEKSHSESISSTDIMGICVRNSDKYRLLDGYHRYVTYSRLKKRKCSILVIS